MTPDPKATPATDHKAERMRSIVGLYVNRLCSCGGSGPRDINACAACWLYHHIREKDEKIATLEAENAKLREERDALKARGEKAILMWGAVCRERDKIQKELIQANAEAASWCRANRARRREEKGGE